jgi:hypothetical protein
MAEAPEHKPKAGKPKPPPLQVYKLMEEYTRIDYLMAETLLMQTEEELERYLAMPIENNVNE